MLTNCKHFCKQCLYGADIWTRPYGYSVCLSIRRTQKSVEPPWNTVTLWVKWQRYKHQATHTVSIAECAFCFADNWQMFTLFSCSTITSLYRCIYVHFVSTSQDGWLVESDFLQIITTVQSADVFWVGQSNISCSWYL